MTGWLATSRRRVRFRPGRSVSLRVCRQTTVAPGFKNKIRYTPYVSPKSQISHIATNKGNIKRQCSIYNVLSIKDIILNSKQRKDNYDLQVKTLIHRDNCLVDHKPNSSKL